MASRRGPRDEPRGNERAAPDAPTRVGLDAILDDDAEKEPERWPDDPTRTPTPTVKDVGAAAVKKFAQARTTVFSSDRHPVKKAEPLFADDDSLAPFSATSHRAQPLYAPSDPQVMDLLTADVDLSDITAETDAPSIAERVLVVSSAPSDIPQAPTKIAAVRVPARESFVPALQLSRRPIIRDFDEDLATRVKDAEARDPSLEAALELSLSDALSPSGPGLDPRMMEASGREEKSVVRRIVKSVVAHLPRAFQSAAEKSGIIKLPGVSMPVMGASRTGSQAIARGVDSRAWREARTAPIFDGLPNEALREALSHGKLQILRVDRDTVIPVGGGLVLVRSGQVALAQFPPDKLELERIAAEKLLAQNPLIGKKLDKKERRRRAKAGALIRMAEKNLATFEEGDVVEVSLGARRHDTLGIYAVTPVTVLTIEREVAEQWRSTFPFMADRLRRAGASARARVEATAGAKAIVADFFIRHGLSVSLTLRVRKLDACIECGACEKACEDRYGAKRLSLNGRILGNLDFVDACHTCTDQRCIDPCNFDAISFDTARKEVLINEANCTGCTLCAVACPYDAIEMHELDDKPKLKLRLQKSGALAHGDGAGRKATLRRIASKCDHCAFYEDQACISACPTGALVEVLPSDVVGQLPDQAKATARAGFDRTVGVDIALLNTSNPFERKGLAGLPELGRARARRGRLSINFWWFLGLASFAIVCAEIALRKFSPAHSLSYFVLTRADGLDHEMAISKVDYQPGCELAVNLGYVGTALMITGLAYVWRRRMPFMRNVGSLRTWFDWHVLSGVIGPLFILLHTAAKLDNWVSLAFWSMIATVFSGLLGRYLTTQLPQAASIATVETLEVDRQLGKLRIEHPGVRVADGWFEEYRRRLAAFEMRLDGPKNSARPPREPTVGDGVRAVLWLLKDDLARGGRSRRLANALAAAVRGPTGRRVRKRAHKLALRLARLERRRVLLPRLEPLFLRWKAIHVPMAIALTIIATIHIFLSLQSS